MKRGIGRILLLSLLGSLPLQAGIPRYGTSEILIVPGQVDEVFGEDLDNDGRNELLVFCHTTGIGTTRPVRKLLVYGFNPKNGSMVLEADTELASDDIAYDLGDVDKDGTKELVLLEPDRLSLLSWTGSGFSSGSKQPLEAGSFFFSSDPSRILQWTFLADLDADSLPEILVPQPEGLTAFSRTGNGTYVRSGRFWIPWRTSASDRDGVTLAVTLPRITIQDFNGDGFQDLLAVSGSRCDVFFLHSEAAAADPSRAILPNLSYIMELRNPSPSALESLAPASLKLRMEDLDNDGCSDMIISKSSRAGFQTAISQIQIFRNRGGRLGLLPDQILTSENVNAEYSVADWNRDGLFDLALFSLKIGFTDAAAFFLFRRANHEVTFHAMRPDRTYSNDPDFSMDFSRTASIRRLFESEICATLAGDFTGDAFPDLVLGIGRNRLWVLPALPDGSFSEKGSFRISVPFLGRLVQADFDGDGCDDPVLYDPADPSHDGQIGIVLSSWGIRP